MAYKDPIEIKLDGNVKKVSSEELKKIWVAVHKYDKYEVNPLFGIRNRKTKKILKGRTWLGYPKVTLMSDGKKHEIRIHRVIAETFLPKKNPSYNIVNHKDGNRQNFSIYNLEWVDQSLNIKDRWLNRGKRPKYKPEYPLKSRYL